MAAEWNSDELAYLMNGFYDYAGDVSRDMSMTAEMVACVDMVYSDLGYLNQGFHSKTKLQIALEIRARIYQYRRFKSFIQEDGVQYDEETNVVTVSVDALRRGVAMDLESMDFWIFGLEYYGILKNLVEQNRLGRVDYDEVVLEVAAEEVAAEVATLALPNVVMDIVGPPFIPVIEYPLQHH